MMPRTKRSNQRESVQVQPPSISFKPRHPEQLLALDVLKENDIVFLSGPAGTAKTFIAVWYAISTAIQSDRVAKIYISRPAVTSGAEIGFVPGDVNKKMSEFLTPIFDARDKIGGKSIDQIRGYFEIAPLCYIRGRTFENSILIVDEAQNLTPDEIVTLVTRIGDGGKIIFCGDTIQNDLYGGHSVLDLAAATYAGANRGGVSVGWYQFTRDAIVRSPIIGLLLDLTEQAGWYRERNKRR